MDNERNLRQEEIARLLSERQKLTKQICESRWTIECSQQLLKKIDEQLVKSVLKP